VLLPLTSQRTSNTATSDNGLTHQYAPLLSHCSQIEVRGQSNLCLNALSLPHRKHTASALRRKRRLKSVHAKGNVSIGISDVRLTVHRDSVWISDVWLTVRRDSVWIRKTNWMSLFVFFISLLIVAQHVSGNHVTIIRS
jgi:hypothetical protein